LQASLKHSGNEHKVLVELLEQSPKLEIQPRKGSLGGQVGYVPDSHLGCTGLTPTRVNLPYISESVAVEMQNQLM